MSLWLKDSIWYSQWLTDCASYTYESGEIDFGKGSEKLLKSLHIGTEHGVDVTVTNGQKSRILRGVRGYCRVNMRGKRFKIKLRSNKKICGVLAFGEALSDVWRNWGYRGRFKKIFRSSNAAFAKRSKAEKYFNNGFSVEWEEENCTATLNGELYVKGTEITEEGIYQFIIINRVGTTSTYEIIVDRTAPEAKIFNVDNATDEIKVNYAVSNIYFTWEEAGCSASLNGAAYQKKTYITKDGGYSFTLTDKAGNTAVYNITVVKEKPAIMFISEESHNELKNNSSTTENVLIVKFDDEDIITLNGEIYNTENPLKEIG